MKMFALGSRRSAIRELYEFGKQLAAQKGADAVFDFSIGNPTVPAPKEVNETIRKSIDTLPSLQVHGYTSAQGNVLVRTAIADSIVERFNAPVGPDNIYMTCGAASSLTISINALCEEGDEFLIFAPYFPEYKVFINAAGGKDVSCGFRKEDFQIDFDDFERKLSDKTKAVIVNSPNNPSGVVYTEATIKRLCSILNARSSQYGHPIFLIADEPYRELVYDDIEVPYIMNYYDNCIVCYSFSKSISIPGERIGYIAVSQKVTAQREIYAAICGAGRALGYVCAPNLFQKVAAACVNARPDIGLYKANRDLLYEALTKIGYRCAHPDGAFYLFVEALEKDAVAFSEKAKQYGILVVPGNDFDAPGYVRIAYCGEKGMILRSLPLFEQLYKDYCGA